MLFRTLYFKGLFIKYLTSYITLKMRKKVIFFRERRSLAGAGLDRGIQISTV